MWQSKIKWPVTPCIKAKFATKLQTDKNIKTSNNFDSLTKDFNNSNCCHDTSVLFCNSWKKTNIFEISWLKMTKIELVTSWMADHIRPIMLIMKEAVKIFIRVNIFQFFKPLWSNFSIKSTYSLDSDLSPESGWDNNHCCLTFCTTEQIHKITTILTQNDNLFSPRTIFSENSSHFVSLLKSRPCKNYLAEFCTSALMNAWPSDFLRVKRLIFRYFSIVQNVQKSARTFSDGLDFSFMKRRHNSDYRLSLT